MVWSIKKITFERIQENGSSFWCVKKLCAPTSGPQQFANPYVCPFVWRWDFVRILPIVNHHGITTIWGRIFSLFQHRLVQNLSWPIPETKCLFFFYISERSITHSIYLVWYISLHWSHTKSTSKARYITIPIPWIPYGYYESLTPLTKRPLADEFYWAKKNQHHRFSHRCFRFVSNESLKVKIFPQLLL